MQSCIAITKIYNSTVEDIFYDITLYCNYNSGNYYIIRYCNESLKICILHFINSITIYCSKAGEIWNRQCEKNILYLIPVQNW
jgi:hypothetical protein